MGKPRNDFFIKILFRIFEGFLAKQSTFYKVGAGGGADPEDLEGFFVFGELGEVLFGEGFLDGFLVGGVDEGDAGAFEAGTGEASAIDSGEGAHDVVDGDELWGATLVIMDGALA